jgi:hypothetical protein
MIGFGMFVEDVVTHFKGTVTGCTNYITGCTSYLVQPPCKPDGDFVEARWFDVGRLRVVDARVVELPGDPAGKTGPDMPAPIR